MYFGNNPQLPATITTDVSTSSWDNIIQTFPYIDNDARAILKNNPSRWRQFMLTAKQRMIVDMKEDANADALRSLFQFQHLVIREECNDRLIRGSATIRAETIKDAQKKLVDVAEDLSRNQQRLITSFEKCIVFCKNIQSPLLKEKYQKALANIIEDAFDTFEKLSKHFNQFLDTRLGAQAPASF